MSTHSKPAILGGTPARTKPYPKPNAIGKEEKALVAEVLDDGILSDYVAHHGPSFNGGRMVKAIEAEFCKVFGSKFAVSVNSATSGLHCALAGALAGYGDEVIIPPYTMSATATTVAQNNATPVFADIDENTFCLDVADVKRKLSPRTKAIVAVNLFGGPAALDELRAICDERGIFLIEDNAQGPAATLGGKYTGTIGHMGVFSLNCHKTIQCGEGGVILTDDEKLADRMRLMRNHGEVVQSQRPSIEPELAGMLGYNYRMSELHAAVGLAQLRKLEALTAPRIDMANVLTEHLRGIDGITPPFVARGNRHVYYMYAMKVDAKKIGLSRQQLKSALDAEGVMVAPGYVRPIYLYPMYEARVRDQKRGFGAGVWHPAPDSGIRYERGACPVTERMHFEELLLTNICRADLGRDDAMELVHAFEKVLAHRDEVRAKLVADGIQ